MSEALIDAIVGNLCEIGDPVVEKVSAERKREVSYELGVQLGALREQYPRNEEFGEKRSLIIEKMSERGYKKPSLASLGRYPLLPEFGELFECEFVGFTKVYKLMEEKYTNARWEIKALLSELQGDKSKKQNKALNTIVSDRLKEIFARPPVYTQEQLDRFMRAASENLPQVVREEVRQDGAADVYYGFLNVVKDDFEDDAELRVATKQAIRSLERRYHPDRNLDDPQRFEREFNFLQQAKSFFNL